MPNSEDGFTPLPAEPGLYDQLIDQQLHDQLAALEQAQAQLAPGIKKGDHTELPDRVGELVSRALASVTITPDDRATAALTLSIDHRNEQVTRQYIYICRHAQAGSCRL